MALSRKPFQQTKLASNLEFRRSLIMRRFLLGQGRVDVEQEGIRTVVDVTA
jgi:hypothetical protein